MQQINGTKLKVVGVSIGKTKGRGFIIQTLPTPCLGLWKSWLFHMEDFYWEEEKNMKTQILNAETFRFKFAL